MKWKILWAVLGVFVAFAAIGIIHFYSAFQEANEGTSAHPSLYVDPEHTYLACYDDGEYRLISTFFRIRNESDEALGPFYVKYIFHDDALVESMAEKRKEIAPERESGSGFIQLPPGEVYQSGHSFTLASDPGLAEALRNRIGPEASLHGNARTTRIRTSRHFSLSTPSR